MIRTALPLGAPEHDLRVSSPDVVFLTDNGRALCGAHLGATARLTGHDLSGQDILPVTGPVLTECMETGFTPRCESCGKEAR